MKTTIIDIGKLNKVELIAMNIIVARLGREASDHSLAYWSQEEIDNTCSVAVKFAKQIVEMAKE